MAERNKRKNLHPQEVSRLREEQVKVVTGCQDQIQHWKKVQSDYEALQQRLSTLPDKLSYDIMVPFGPLAFMPGKLVHTNEVTVLLGDNWFAKCSAKQASNLVEHRKKHVKTALDDLYKVMKDFEARVGFTEDLEKQSSEKGDFVDIIEEVENEEILTKGKQRTAHKPYSRPKNQDVFECGEGDPKATSRILSEEELWARLDELETQEELLDQKDLMSYSGDTNGDDTTSSSSEEEKEHPNGNLPCLHGEEDSRLITFQVNGNGQHHSDDEDDEGSCVPTIYFTHTVEPKRVRINTGKNTTLKFSERKEEAKRKRKNSNGNGHSVPGLTKIKTPADLYRLFVDVVNGELVPRKSILKSRSREDSMCSDTSESSDDRRGFCRNLSHDESTHSDTSEGVLQEDENSPSKPLPLPGVFEAFSGTVVEKDPTQPSLIPHLTIVSPALPTIPERKVEEVVPQVQKEVCKKVSKFKAARMQQQI